MKKQIGQTLDSREAAGILGKEHRELLRDIRRYTEQLTESKIALSEFFRESAYQAGERYQRRIISLNSIRPKK